MKLFILFFISLNSFSIDLEIKGHQILDTKVFDGTKVGGLSGIRYNPKTKKLLAISDDRSLKSPARFYELSLEFEALEAKLERVILLKNKEKQLYKPKSIDFEDIEILENGDLLISSEAQTMGLKIVPSEISIFNEQGIFKSTITVSSKFIPTRENGYFVSGQRNNRGFEALCKSDKDNSFFISSESSLIQDSDNSLRIIKYKDYKSDTEYAYRLEQTYNNISPLLSLGAINTLSAMLCIDDETLITVERSFHPLLNNFSTQLFETKINPLVSNVFQKEFLTHDNVVYLSKKKLLAIEDSDNIEGITFGPILSNGNKSILLITDDNFSKWQKTKLIYIEIKK